MQSSQVILLIAGVLILYVFVRGVLRARSVKQYTPAEAEARMRNSLNIIFLDVRTKLERNKGSIKGSIHLPLHELRSKISELDKYKGKEIICYCRTGRRSLKAASILNGKGYNSSSLRGGLGDWNLYKSRIRQQ
jgi:rhodanese-related sulfurtransferase